MLKIFRKIRQQLLNSGQIKQYSIYAIGEIVLVVLGILIALQINNWNQNKMDHEKEIQYLFNLKNDLKSDTTFMNRFVFNRYDKKMEGLNLAKKYYQGKYEVKDTSQFLAKVSYGAVFANGMQFISSSTFDELVSTGNLQLILDDNLKQSIIRYYSRIKSNINLMEKYESGYLKLINSLKPYDPKNGEYISPLDQIFMLKKLKSEELLLKTNLEITHGKRMKTSLTGIKKQSTELIQLIEKEIEEN